MPTLDSLAQVEGKTKIVRSIPSDDEVLIVSKNRVSYGDGAHSIELEGKAELATRTTANCFRLLKQEGIPNHFLHIVNNNTFRAQKLAMFPLELVVRRFACGSYLKRNPGVESGARFSEPTFEMFAKEDPLHDPLVKISYDEGLIRRYEAGRPTTPEAFLDEMPIEHSRYAVTAEQQAQLGELAVGAFVVLEQAWSELGITLVDAKFEAGMTRSGEIILGDVVDNDSWRLWQEGDPNQPLDKKKLLQAGGTPDDVLEVYKLVADYTDMFAIC